MKKVILLICLAILVIPTVLALNLDVSTNSTNVVMIKDVNEPAIFNLQVENLGSADNIKFYNLLGFVMLPKEPVQISGRETKNIPLEIYPRTDLSYTGYYTFNYVIKGQNDDSQDEAVTFKIINLEDAFEVGASEINPQSGSVKIYIKNAVNFNFESLSVDFNSPFFEISRQFSLAPYEEKQFEIKLNREDFKSLLAGFYTLSAEVTAGGKTSTVEGDINFQEQNILKTSEKKYGFLIFTNIIQKANEGNTVANSQTVVAKNIISRLFTTFDPQPDAVERQGLRVYYTWENKVQPGSTLTIVVRTNWLLPLFVILFVAGIVFIVIQLTKTTLSLNKSVSFLRAKGGEFALKVTIVVTAKKFAERVTIIDRLPYLTKIYEKFGPETPTKVDEKNRRIEWHYEKLMPGETRVLSYILYSKVGVLGRFALPTTRAVFQREGKVHEAESNQAFLITAQGVKKE
ncbi:MAG: hypothetical protein PHH00_02035 [Candidatus Nanoarchaeia archaeon]|nr:hypothetical protein [Candidatus Nanoarchaeia archaeon]